MIDASSATQLPVVRRKWQTAGAASKCAYVLPCSAGRSLPGKSAPAIRTAL